MKFFVDQRSDFTFKTLDCEPLRTYTPSPPYYSDPQCAR